MDRGFALKEYKRERNRVRAIALLIQAALALKWLTGWLQLRSHGSEADLFASDFPHAFPYPLITWIYLAAIVSLIALWSFDLLGIAISSLFNAIVVLSYGIWVYESYQIDRQSNPSLVPPDLWVHRSTWWDLIVCLLSVALLAWEISLIYRTWKADQHQPMNP